MVVWCCCCCCYWGVDSKTSVLNEVVQPKSVFDGFPNLCFPERRFGLNKISHPDWVKLCVDPNARIKLRAKQKCEILSAPISYRSCPPCVTAHCLTVSTSCGAQRQQTYKAKPSVVGTIASAIVSLLMFYFFFYKFND